MKALVTAFALLSFVAATTIPVSAYAATKTEMTKKKPAKKHVKKTSKKSAKKKSMKPGQTA